MPGRLLALRPQSSQFDLKAANTRPPRQGLRFGPKPALAADRRRLDGKRQETYGLYDPATSTFRLKNATLAAERT